MSTGKIIRFRENRELGNVLEHTDYGDAGSGPAGRWHRIFGNEHPLTLELACGRGDTILGLAPGHPDRNFIGIDIKGARIWKGAKRADKEGLNNIRFIRMYIEHLGRWFAKGEADEIWITFPDPFPKDRQAKKRLTSPRFLDLYSKVLRPGGNIHLKTDSESLWEYTLETLDGSPFIPERRIPDLYGDDAAEPELKIRTTYEKRHLEEGRTIRYLRFRLPD